MEYGVSDYSFDDLKSEFEMIVCEHTMNLLNACTMMKPKTLINLFKKMLEDGKDEAFLKVLEQGMFSASIRILACIYVTNKDNFLKAE